MAASINEETKNSPNNGKECPGQVDNDFNREVLNIFILFYFKIFIQVISFILNMFFKLTCLTKNKSAYTKKTREINLPNLNTIQ